MRPDSEDDLAAMIRAASGPLRVTGGGTRSRPAAGEVLDLRGLTGITLYEPEALTLIARAGTPLAEIQAALAAEGQMLAFEPDPRPDRPSGAWRQRMPAVRVACRRGPAAMRCWACAS